MENIQPPQQMPQASTSTPVQSSPAPEPTQTPQAPPSASKNMILLLAAVVTLIIAGILVYVFQSQTTTPPAEQIVPTVETPTPTEAPASEESEASSVDTTVDDSEIQQIQEDASQL